MALYWCIGNRDITDYVYRLVHNEYVRELNEEYKTAERSCDFLSRTYDAGYTMSSPSHGFFMFNYSTGEAIHNVIEIDPLIRLSRNYWHAVLFVDDTQPDNVE